ncbi:MAG: hypothetical protein FRX49_10524 [Trebouxia sp. A1-2]|nr:MAG: hypothetical protein FRX49_10524 [Trebouxia sp. A1-2]
MYIASEWLLMPSASRPQDPGVSTVTVCMMTAVACCMTDQHLKALERGHHPRKREAGRAAQELFLC